MWCCFGIVINVDNSMFSLIWKYEMKKKMLRMIKFWIIDDSNILVVWYYIIELKICMLVFLKMLYIYFYMC